MYTVILILTTADEFFYASLPLIVECVFVNILLLSNFVIVKKDI